MLVQSSGKTTRRERASTLLEFHALQGPILDAPAEEDSELRELQMAHRQYLQVGESHNSTSGFVCDNVVARPFIRDR